MRVIFSGARARFSRGFALRCLGGRFTHSGKLRYTGQMKQTLFAVCLLAFFSGTLSAQNHTSVSLDDPIYHILEQAEMRGLISPLSGTRPFTRNVVITAINELLGSDNAGRLRPLERQILEDYLARFARPEPGPDLRRGAFFGETTMGEREMAFTFNLDVGVELELSSSVIPNFGETHLGAELWVQVDLYGDIGRHASYGFFNQGGIMRLPRRFLGWYNTYYEGFTLDGTGWSPEEYVNRLIRVYSGPLTHFPFSHRKRWDGSIFPLQNLTGFRYWPEVLSGGYSLQSELTASFLEDRFIMRLGRIPREWGSMPLGSSLTFNSAARPFLAGEIEFRPVPWFGISSLTGILEYHNREGIKRSSMTNQNAFSITMFQLRFRNYLFLDLIDAVVWPKRFELAYISPITLNFFAQNNIGDFDNMALALNLRAQYPGLGNVWFSIFVDEMNIQRNMLQLDRTMIAYQAGLNIPLPFLAFSSLRFSYTKVNPYTFTHNRNFNPWYSGYDIDGRRQVMETAWTNHGVALGHYLPPNSDEFKLQFRTMPARNVSMTLQYQMIRRGATWGSSAVDGSHLLSELNPNRGEGNQTTWRFFLRDGAYHWMHIVRAGGNWRLPNLPVSVFGEAGVVFSYFTNIDAPANNAGLEPGERPRPHPFRRINTPEYPMSTNFMFRIGFRLFR